MKTLHNENTDTQLTSSTVDPIVNQALDAGGPGADAVGGLICMLVAVFAFSYLIQKKGAAFCKPIRGKIEDTPNEILETRVVNDDLSATVSYLDVNRKFDLSVPHTTWNND